MPVNPSTPPGINFGRQSLDVGVVTLLEEVSTRSSFISHHKYSFRAPPGRQRGSSKFQVPN